MGSIRLRPARRRLTRQIRFKLPGWRPISRSLPLTVPDSSGTSTGAASPSGFHFDRRRLAVWVYNPSTQTFWTYDDPTTIRLKTIYINRGALRGAFVWAVKDDDSNATLITAMAAGLSGSKELK